MASIIVSARNSTSSVFDLFGVTATTAVDLVKTAGQGVSMLSSKADVMHARVSANCKLQKLNLVHEEALAAADSHADLVEESHRRNYPNVTFDRATFHAAAVTRFLAALSE